MNAKPGEVRQIKWTAEHHLIRDPANQMVDRENFCAMMDADRYKNRSRNFNEIISATHVRFWDANEGTK